MKEGGGGDATLKTLSPFVASTRPQPIRNPNDHTDWVHSTEVEQTMRPQGGEVAGAAGRVSSPREAHSVNPRDPGMRWEQRHDPRINL